MAASIKQRLVLLFVTKDTGRIELFMVDYFTRSPIYYNFSFTIINATNFSCIPSLKLKILKGDVNTCMHVFILYILEKRYTIEGLLE